MAPDGAVTVRTYRRAREIVGRKEVRVPIDDGTTVRRMLATLAEDHGVPPDEAIVMVNGRNINHLDGPETTVQVEDLVSVTVDPTPD